MTMHWSGFQGNREAVVLGYPSDIAFYQYAIGMFNYHIWLKNYLCSFVIL